MNFNYILQVVGSFSDSDFVNWASEQKIIQDINQLHFCSSCYNLMKLCYSDRYPDGAIYSSVLTEHAEIQCRYVSTHGFQMQKYH